MPGRRHPHAGEQTDVGFVDLFAGCGGLSLGFVLEGFEPVFAVESDADAVETYQTNIDERVHGDDIKTVTAWPKACFARSVMPSCWYSEPIIVSVSSSAGFVLRRTSISRSASSVWC